jgi:hypothetical protein
MSLNVKAIDRYKGHIDLTVEDVQKAILIDDSLDIIKEKLFLFGVSEKEVDYLYNPNLLKLESNSQVLTKTHSLLNAWEKDQILPKKPTIYVTHLIDQIRKEAPSLEERGSKLNELKKTFVDLTLEDLEFAYNYINNEPISEDYTSREDLLIERLSKKYPNDFYIDNFYKLSEKPLKEPVDIIYTNVEFKIRTRESQSKIRIEKLFNTFELTGTIPLIALSRKYASEYTKGPLVKVSNTLLETVPDKEIKGWLLNEKTKLNQASFKIIKGLMLKIKMYFGSFLTLNIMPDGYMIVNFNIDAETYEKESFTLDKIIELVKNTINEVLVNLNQLDNRKILEIGLNDIEIESMDTTMYTNFEINRSKFSKLLLVPSVSENILELKNIQSQELISMYYKKIAKADTKGLTINIKENPFKENSSIINIFNGENVMQLQVIYATIRVLNELNEFATQNKKGELVLRERKLKEITTKSLLKKEGFVFDSKKCQKPSQPIIVKDNTIDEHTIRFDKWTFRCTNDKKPYPGFHSDNIPCCYKKPQVGKETYIRNVDPESLEILVKPSNLKVKIKAKGIEFDTFVIKKISDIFDSDNNYFYLSDQNKLVPITDSKTVKYINKIKEEGNIWLETVTLSEMIYPASTHKCQKRPELNPELTRQGINTFVNYSDINKSCDIYKNAGYFGFASSSIPCCYNTEREIYITKNKREENKLNKYIATTSNKLLNYKKMGVLPHDLDQLFNKLLGNFTEELEAEAEADAEEGEVLEAKVKKNNYYRMGVVQNKSSFLNVVLMGIDNEINGNEIYGIVDFKTILINYITKELFVKLNNGKVALKYHSIDNYIRYIKENTILWEDMIDLLEMITRHNILILDTDTDTDVKTRILCRTSDLKEEYPFLILLKKSNAYELVVKLNVDESSELYVMKSFDRNNPILQFLIDYQNATCIKENIYPENYPYKPLQKIDQLKVNIKYQIVNSFNLVNMIMTDQNVLIPVVETGIVDNVPVKSLDDMDDMDDTNLLTLNDYIKYSNITILGITKSNRESIGGILTDYGFLVPYKITKEEVPGIPLLNFVYYMDVDTQLRSGKVGPVLVDRTLMNDIFKIKTKIVKALDQISNGEQVKEYLLDIIKVPEMTRHSKITTIIDVFKQFGKTTPDNYTLFILNIIANEMISDNKENALLNGIVANPEEKGENIIKRDTESILLNLDDIYRWIRLYK